MVFESDFFKEKFDLFSSTDPSLEAQEGVLDTLASQEPPASEIC